MVIKNAKVILEDRVIKNGFVRFNGSLIEEVGEGACSIKDNEFDAKGCFVCPGFVDLHTHGSGGADLMDGTKEAIMNAASSYVKYGTTTVLATTETCSDEQLFSFIDNMKSLRDEGCLSGKDSKGKTVAKIPGIHFEGPYFSLEFKGAQDDRYLKIPERKHWTKIYDQCDGLMKRFSVAPELGDAMDLIKTFSDRGILVSAAHTSAIYDCISKAYDLGLKQLTHFYSAMSSLTRKGGFRILGTIESGYAIDDLYVELICDGKHLPKELLQMIFKCKRHDRITACSDSMRGAGMPEGPSIMGSLADGMPCIIEDGVAKVMDRSCFAGSVATGDNLARTLLKLVGLEPSEMSRILCLQPAKLIGMDNEIGSIKVGKKADLVVFDNDVRIKKVFVEGVSV